MCRKDLDLESGDYFRLLIEVWPCERWDSGVRHDKYPLAAGVAARALGTSGGKQHGKCRHCRKDPGQGQGGAWGDAMR